MEQETVIIPYVKLPPRADRFYGGHDVEIEIGGKRTHAHLDTGTYGQIMLQLSSSVTVTSSYSTIITTVTVAITAATTMIESESCQVLCKRGI